MQCADDEKGEDRVTNAGDHGGGKERGVGFWRRLERLGFLRCKGRAYWGRLQSSLFRRHDARSRRASRVVHYKRIGLVVGSKVDGSDGGPLQFRPSDGGFKTLRGKYHAFEFQVRQWPRPRRRE